VTEEMAAEFDTVAEWTAEAAARLGPSFYIPAGCRGSGSPAALDWLSDELHLLPDETLLDCGAGVGGPAARAARRQSVKPVLVDPEAGACRAARKLFDHPVVCADATALPFDDESFDAAWSLGVLCTVQNQLGVLEELRRMVRPPGRIGLLVYVARTPAPSTEQPKGNHFPTPESLADTVEAAGLRVHAWRSITDLDPAPREWQERVDAVTAELRDRHGHEQAWQLAERQSDLVSQLIADSAVSGELLSLRRV
jgi:SAM-dependent methyltransferase